MGHVEGQLETNTDYLVGRNNKTKLTPINKARFV
jgi:hypothetical protein